MPALHVIDISRYQADPDFVAARKAGLVGVIIKATEGTTWVDPTFAARYDKAKKAGLAVATYHFLKHGNVAQQVNHYLDTVKPDVGERVCIDFEDKATTLDDLKAAINEIWKFDKSLQVTVYGGSMLKEALGSKHDPVLAETSLWLAQYTSGDPSWPTGTWPYWSLWQYSDGSVGGKPRQMDGFKPPFDCNTFNGSAENCQRWLAPVIQTPSVTPKPIPAPVQPTEPQTPPAAAPVSVSPPHNHSAGLAALIAMVIGLATGAIKYFGG